AEQFTGIPGKYVKVEESIRGFKEILEGKHDELPERAFFMKGSIDEVVADAGGSQAQEKDDSEQTGSAQETEASSSESSESSEDTGDDTGDSGDES
ncbi:MAG: hypothetical protein ACRDK8_00045, partial [Solirubrobacteraceae bacterium]